MPRPSYLWLPSDPWAEEEWDEEQEQVRKYREEELLEEMEGRTNDEPQ